MRGRRFDLIVAEGLAASGAIASLRTASAEAVTPILVVAPAHDVEARIAFLEAGADDVIDGGFANSELEGRVMALLIRAGKVRPESASRTGSAELVAFFSPKGGVGTTTLAVNTAVLLAGGGGPTPGPARATEPGFPASRVLLIDLDLQFGQVATHLNLTPRYDIAGLASDEQALADPELAAHVPHDPFVRPHRPRRADPPGGRLPGDARAPPAHLRDAAAVVRPHPRRPREPARSPRRLAARAGRRPCLRPLPGDRGAARDEPADGLPGRDDAAPGAGAIVVNHVFPKELLKTRDVENLLRTKPAAEIPYTEVEMIRSVNEGVPLVIGRPALTGHRRPAAGRAGGHRHRAASGGPEEEGGASQHLQPPP